MATYLSLTNDLLSESGTTLDQLTSLNFATASTLDPMYGKMKGWVNKAWKEIQQNKLDYEWRVGTALVVVRPRIRFYNAIDLGAGTFEGNAVSGETGVSFALGTPIYTDAGNTEGYADIIGYPTTADPLSDDNTLNFSLRMGEAIYFPDATAPDSSYRFFGWGEYNLIDQNEPLDSPLTDVQTIHHSTMQYLSDDSSVSQSDPLPYIPWHEWMMGFEGQPGLPASPRAYTQNMQGKLLFREPLDRPYRLKFTYTKSLNELSLHNDIPQGLDPEWHDMIMWRALEFYGRYDSQPDVVQNAQKEQLTIRRRMEALDTPTTFFNPNTRW